MVKKNLICAVLALLLLSSCGGTWIPISIDQTLGEQSKAEINSRADIFPILDEAEYPEPYQRLNLIRDKILSSGKITHQQDFNWEVKIIEDDSVLNAFCLPGGYIYVYTGLMKYLDSENALAGVLAHEIAHADKRHATKQLIKNLGISFVLQYVIGSNSSGLLNIGANLLSLSFSRADETDADMNSVTYLYQTDYDARGAAIFFEKIKKEQKEEGITEFLSTHPNPDNRIEEIQKKWKELGGNKGKIYKEEYQKMLEELP
jgi:predicted Zn-dependent protease